MHARKKVVFILNNFLVGGVERLLFDVIASLDKQYYDVRIVTILGSGPLEKSFRDLGVPIYFAGSRRGYSRGFLRKLWRIITAPAVFLKIGFFLIKINPTVVITSLYQADVLGVAAAKCVRVPHRIIIQHDVQKLATARKFFKERIALKNATRVVSISDTVRIFLKEYFRVVDEKITVIRNGIDFERFSGGEKEWPTWPLLVIGIVGRLDPVKGHMYALQAMRRLKEAHHIEPRVLIIGEGGMRGTLTAYGSIGRLNSVEFLGEVKDVIPLLRQVDVIIVPSVEEGFGLAALEGLVSGKVILASDISAMRELIRDGENGLLFKNKDAESLSDALNNILTDKALFDRLRAGSASWAAANRHVFDMPEVVKRYKALIDTCL